MLPRFGPTPEELQNILQKHDPYGKSIRDCRYEREAEDLAEKIQMYGGIWSIDSLDIDIGATLYAWGLKTWMDKEYYDIAKDIIALKWWERE